MGLSKTQFGNSGRRNKVINGAMQVAQRGTSGSGTANSGYTVDRFSVSQSNMDELVLAVTQESDGPTGFGDSLKIRTTTIEQAVATDEISHIRYAFEGKDLQQLEYGTTDAKSFVLSFWVKCSSTGNFGISAYKKTGGSNDRLQERQYTINTADTWERKSLVFAGETMSGREIDNATTMGMTLYWWLDMGTDYGTGTYNGATGWQTYSAAQYGASHDIGKNNMSNTIVGALNKYIQITGVQLEVGTTLTDYEHRLYSDELQACKRYYEEFNFTNSHYIANGYYDETNKSHYILRYVEKASATPAVTFSGTSSHFKIRKPGAGDTTAGTLTSHDLKPKRCFIQSASNPTAATVGHGSMFSVTSTAKVHVSSEI